MTPIFLASFLLTLCQAAQKETHCPLLLPPDATVRYLTSDLGGFSPIDADTPGPGHIAFIMCKAENNYWFRLCMSNGSWGEPIGETSKCPVTPDDGCPDLPEIPNGELRYDDPDKAFGSIVHVSCNPKFRIWPRWHIGTRICQWDGSWSDQGGVWTGVNTITANFRPRCEKIRCHRLETPSYARIEYRDSDGELISGTESVLGSVAKYICSGNRFLVDGSTTRTCNKDGQWSGSQPTCVRSTVTCSELKTPANGAISYSRDGTMFINMKLYEHTSAFYGCFQGHSLVGDSRRNCQSDGTWSGKEPICNLTSAICPKLKKPAAERGSIHYNWEGFMTWGVSEDTVIYEDTVATYSCEKPYTLTGDAKRTCQSDGTWSGKKSDCTATCRKLIDPMDGEIRYTDSKGRKFYPGSKETIFEGTVATYECNPGYKRFGSSYRRTCQSDQTWTDGYASCLYTPEAIKVRLLGMLLQLVS